MTTLHAIIERRLREEQDSTAEAERILSEQRGKIELLLDLKEELGEQAAEVPKEVHPATTDQPVGYSRERVEIALEVYEELLRRVSPEPLRPFRVAPEENTVLEWMTIHGGGVQGLRKWAIEQSGFFQSVLIMISPERRDLLIWDYEVIPAIIDRCDFRDPMVITPSTEDILKLIDDMTAQQLAAITKRAGGSDGH